MCSLLSQSYMTYPVILVIIITALLYMLNVSRTRGETDELQDNRQYVMLRVVDQLVTSLTRGSIEERLTFVKVSQKSHIRH